MFCEGAHNQSGEAKLLMFGFQLGLRDDVLLGNGVASVDFNRQIRFIKLRSGSGSLRLAAVRCGWT